MQCHVWAAPIFEDLVPLSQYQHFKITLAGSILSNRISMVSSNYWLNPVTDLSFTQLPSLFIIHVVWKAKTLSCFIWYCEISNVLLLSLYLPFQDLVHWFTFYLVKFCWSDYHGMLISCSSLFWLLHLIIQEVFQALTKYFVRFIAWDKLGQMGIIAEVWIQDLISFLIHKSHHLSLQQLVHTFDPLFRDFILIFLLSELILAVLFLSFLIHYLFHILPTE